MRLIIPFLLCFALSAMGQRFGKTAAFKGAAAVHGTAGSAASWAPTNAYGWWHADSLLPKGDGTIVTTLADSAGTHPLNVISNDSTRGPWFTNGILNGYPVMWWTNGNFPRSLTNNFGGTLAQPLTFIFAIRSIHRANGNYQYIMDGIVSSPRVKIIRDGSTPFTFMATAGAILGSADVNPETWCICSICLSNGNSYIRTNGVNLAVGNAGTGGLTGLTIGDLYSSGAASVIYGGIAEIILYKGLMATNDLIWAETGLKTKYGL